MPAPQSTDLPPLFLQAADHLTALLRGKVAGRSQSRVRELERLRKQCREGNPFPLIAFQWPELIVPADSPDAALFRSYPAEKAKHVPRQLLDIISLPSNPVLRLDWWQQIILAAFFDPTIGEIFIKGCTGAGKGASVSIAVCLWYDVYKESRTSLTSRDWTHCMKGIFGEVKQWFDKMADPAASKALENTIADPSNAQRHYIGIVNPDPSSKTAGEAFSGAHGKNTLAIFDEATSAPPSFIENSEKNARKIVALANPRTLSGRFRESFKPLGERINENGTCIGTLGNRLCITVDGADCANVRHKRLKNQVAPNGGIEIDGTHFPAGAFIPPEHFARVQPMIPSQIDLLQYNAICAKPDQRLVDIFAHGKFPDEDPELQVILNSWMERAEKFYDKAAPPAVEGFGLDVARSVDGDSTCLAAGGSRGLRKLHLWKYADTTYHVDEVLKICRNDYGIELAAGRNPITVDCDGLGAGVADQLRQRGCWVIDFRGNAGSTIDPKTYGNARCEAYAVLGRRLNPNDRWAGEPFAFPVDENSERVRQELSAPEKVFKGGDAIRFHITPKNRPPGTEEGVKCIKDTIGRSPDCGDAVVYFFNSIRVKDNLDQWFAAYQRPLVMYPAAGQAPIIATPQANASFPQGPAEDTEPVPRIEQTTELGKYLEEEYGQVLDGQGRPIRRVPVAPVVTKPKERHWTESVSWRD